MEGKLVVNLLNLILFFLLVPFLSQTHKRITKPRGSIPDDDDDPYSLPQDIKRADDSAGTIKSNFHIGNHSHQYGCMYAGSGVDKTKNV